MRSWSYPFGGRARATTLSRVSSPAARSLDLRVSGAVAPSVAVQSPAPRSPARPVESPAGSRQTREPWLRARAESIEERRMIPHPRHPGSNRPICPSRQARFVPLSKPGSDEVARPRVDPGFRRGTARSKRGDEDEKRVRSKPGSRRFHGHTRRNPPAPRAARSPARRSPPGSSGSGAACHGAARW